AAANTVWVLVTLTRNTVSGVAWTGEGMAARWTTASIPGRTSAPEMASRVWPKSVRSARRDGAGEAGGGGAAERCGGVGVGRLGRRDLVDVQHLVAVLQQVPDDGPPGLPAPPGDGDPGHEPLLSVPERISTGTHGSLRRTHDAGTRRPSHTGLQ